MLAIVLALGSAVGYGISDFLGGLKARTVPLLAVLLVSQGVALVLLAAFVIITGQERPGDSYLLYAVLAGLSETVGLAALYRGLAVGVMSIVSPIGATGPVIAVVVGIAVGEAPSALQGAGIVLAGTGIVLTASEPHAAERARLQLNASVVYGLLTAVGFGGFYVAMDAASEGDISWALVTARVSAVAVFLVVVPFVRGALAMRREDAPALAAIGLLIIAADALYATASTHGLLSVVAILSSLYPLATIALARFYLDERVSALQSVGIAMCLGGIAAIAGG